MGSVTSCRFRGVTRVTVSKGGRRLLYSYDAAELDDLRAPPGNRLEALKGRLNGCHSIRINDQWRVVFRWVEGRVQDVAVMDYH